MRMNASHTFIAAALVLALSSPSLGYSVLTHEALVDATWESHLKPLLLKRFPGSTVEQLREAHAHAYGGAIIQDLGYYPFGNKFFSDLAHYVRSGDFVEMLLAEAQDINEYSFALGALQHHAADNNGHPIATNRSVPLLFPKLRQKFGPVVTYEDGPSAHLRTEFGFDVSQVAKGNFAADAYHDFIGFKVSKSLLERAFARTYGLELKSVFPNLDLALGTYQYAVSTLIPEMTKVAWQTRKDEIVKLTPGATRDKFVYSLSRASYEKEWGKTYKGPGALAKFLSCLFRILPKIGPLKALAFKPLTPEAEQLFIASFNASLDRYRVYLGQVEAGHLDLENQNNDTGKLTRAGEYRLADRAYAKLLDKLADEKFQGVTPAMRANILAFYNDLDAPLETKKDRDEWKKTLQALTELKAFQR
ncbi:MAG: zinc dependent phospholipase C family protein [Acidobacteriota bacterium]